MTYKQTAFANLIFFFFYALTLKNTMQNIIQQSVAYAGFWKGGEGARKFRKFENNKHQNENFSTQNQSGSPVQIR